MRKVFWNKEFHPNNDIQLIWPSSKREVHVKHLKEQASTILGLPSPIGLQHLTPFALVFAPGMVSCGVKRMDTPPKISESLHPSHPFCCFLGNSWICSRHSYFCAGNKGFHLTVSSHSLYFPVELKTCTSCTEGLNVFPLSTIGATLAFYFTWAGECTDCALLRDLNSRDRRSTQCSRQGSGFRVQAPMEASYTAPPLSTAVDAKWTWWIILFLDMTQSQVLQALVPSLSPV